MLLLLDNRFSRKPGAFLGQHLTKPLQSKETGQAEWLLPAIPAPGRQNQGDPHKSKVCLGYKMRPCLSCPPSPPPTHTLKEN